MSFMRIIGHGIDLTEVKRIAAMLDAHGQRFLERCFTADERAYAESSGRGRAERYAARFAGKEAVLKSLGTGLSGGARWTDVAIVHEDSGRPSVRLSGSCADVAHALGVRSWHVSLSHSGGLAMASAIACGDPPGASR